MDGTIVGSLIEMLDQKNSIAHAFRMARDWYHSHTFVNVELRLLSKRTNSRQYNSPTVAEVGEGEPTRDIIVNMKDGRPKRILELHPSYMAVKYPLDYVTMKEYYAYVIQYRQNQGTTLHRGGRPFQQYLIDAYTAIEEQRLTGLGKGIVLPHTFTRGPRYMMQNYQDAMALCRAYGNPDMLITFTSNPKWPKINEMLAHVPGQRAHDRPEVGTRVFKLKLTELLDDLTKNKIFGESRTGNKPCLLNTELATSYKLTPGEIDDIISAELPSPTDDPAGYKAVTDYMLHGPCGKDA
ncbi:DNA helicase PIF1, ATP-dependent, partial [Tanacetum coccineum]